MKTDEPKVKLPDSRARLHTNGKFINGKWATWRDADGEGRHATLLVGKALVYWTEKDGVYRTLPRERK